MKPILCTYSNVFFDVSNPKLEDIRIEDIAHSLSNQCRFGGHTRKHYSVAQHSVLVSLIVSKELALMALLHDASEAYLVDLPRPIKYGTLLGKEYAKIEVALMKVIFRRFGLPEVDELPGEIKLADDQALVTEIRDVTNRANYKIISSDKISPVNPLPDKIIPLSPRECEIKFLDRFLELSGVMGAVA